ncbi:MAG: hypothetical protein JWM59_1997 [Verrucomicrobiales bacterium]|nr:hypothetical protein [Verrucomicrobiales bacterium]
MPVLCYYRSMSTTADATLEAASFTHPVWAKPIFSRTDALSVLPGGGSGILRQLLAARWIAPSAVEGRPFYRSADVRTALERLGKGELPKPIHVWKAAIGGEGRPVAHVVLEAGRGRKRAACGCGSEWFSASPGMGRCPRCAGLAKLLRVEES